MKCLILAIALVGAASAAQAVMTAMAIASMPAAI